MLWDLYLLPFGQNGKESHPAVGLAMCIVFVLSTTRHSGTQWGKQTQNDPA